MSFGVQTSLDARTLRVVLAFIAGKSNSLDEQARDYAINGRYAAAYAASISKRSLEVLSESLAALVELTDDELDALVSEEARNESRDRSEN